MDLTHATTVVAAAWGLAAAPLCLACEADLDTACIGGDRTCDPAQIPLGEASCWSDCDPETPLRGGEYPCEIEHIMTGCRYCHRAVEPPAPAPFPLDTYAQSQILREGTPIWQLIKPAVESGAMPPAPSALSDAEKTALVAGWICKCAPAREDGVSCE